MNIKERIILALGLNKDEEIKLGWQSKSEDGTIFVSTAEELEAGVDISVLTEDGTTIPLPAGTYKTDTGVSFRVEEEGIVGEVIESETEEKETPKEEMKEEIEMEKKEDKEEDEEDEEEMKKKEDYESEAEETDWAKTYEEMKEKVENLEDAVADIKARLGESGDVDLSEEVEEEKPKTVTTKTTEVVEFSAEDEIKKLKEENKKLKTELAKTPADAPINTNKFSSEKPKLSKAAYSRMTKRERILLDL